MSRHRLRQQRSHRVLKRVLIGVGVFALVITSVLYLAIRHLDGNIKGIKIPGYYATDRPAKVIKGPVNVLVMGDDTRKGQGPQIGGVTPGLSDTAILLHLSANRKFAYGVSLPRDAMVQRPACETSHGESPAQLTQFNAAYAVGGPLCTMKTVEQLTGVRIDHFVVVKFSGFRTMVDALGGVQVCVPERIDDAHSNIHLPAGTYDVTGEQALNYVRVRHGVGDGSDIGRMKRQQAFIASMINKVVSAGTLANPVRLYKFLDAATKSVQMDEGFSHLRSLVGLGESLKHIGLAHIKFITVPFQAYPPDPNRVEWAPQASRLWHQIKMDQPLHGTFDSQTINASNTPGSRKAGKAGNSAGTTSRVPADNSSPGSPTTPSPSQVEAAHQVGLCA